MHGLRWQAMETETTAPSLDPTLICPSSGKDTAKTKGVHFAEAAIRKLERALNSYDNGEIQRAKEEFRAFLEKIEE